MTDKYPDIVSLVPLMAPGVSSFILDAEVVAMDAVTGAVASFQTLSERKRKNVEEDSVEVQVCVMAFDLMFIDGVSLIKEPFRVRRDRMRKAFTPVDKRFAFVEQIESSEPDEIEAFLTRSLLSGCEGIMVKVLDPPPAVSTNKRSPHLSSYEPDKRSDAWLKVKRDYLSHLADTFDLVPIAGWMGTGRKAGWWSPVLLACWNNRTETWESFCKCISGFTDQFYKDMQKRYTPESGRLLPGPKPYFAVSDSMHPDVWFRPSEVWEIRGADLTVSPVHQAARGMVDEGRGISLRFPRFIKLREDKGIEDATTPEQIVEIFEKQRIRGPAIAHVDAADEAERSPREADEEDDREGGG
ncbi:hypothetical protein HKX48_000692 [Thoreauomyces humboldtii]|nr:hypothetical protein HKX48_000692 [Thoreauomyces humboldtii]